MKTCKCYHGWEEEQREILLGVLTRFYRFSKGVFFRISAISTGRNGRLRPGKLLILSGHIGNKTRQEWPIKTG